jgi:hypothetical protein
MDQSPQSYETAGPPEKTPWVGTYAFFFPFLRKDNAQLASLFVVLRR